MLGQFVGISCRSARQQFHQLAEDYSQNERLHAEDIAVRQAHHLHHALQTGLCAQREEWQDGAEKVGLKAVMRDGIDYEFTIVFDINMKHQCMASKDRTNLFAGKPTL